MKPIRRVQSWNKGSQDQQEGQSNFISPSRHKMAPYLTIYFNKTETVDAFETSLTATVTMTATTTASASIVIDPYYSSVVLLIHANGINGSTTFIDSSLSPKTITTNGNAQISTTQFKWSGSSGYFDGTGDYLSIPTSSNFAFGTGDFTIELWFRANGSGDKTIISNCDAADNNYFGIGLSSGIINYQIRDNTSQFITLGSISISNDTWYHLAWCRSGNNFYGFINGVLDQTSTSPKSITQRSILVGGFIYSSFSNYWNGYIDDLRITKGVARYTSNFTVPAAEYSEVSSESDTYFNSVSLLMPMNGVSGSTNFIDYSSLSNTISVNGNTYISSTKYKWGGSSGLFDGTTDWLYAPVGSVNFGTGDFTVEGWFNWASLTNAGLFQVYPGTPPNTTAGVAVGYDGVDFQIYSGNANYGRNYTPTTSTWYHVALVRNSSSLTLYVNGVAQGASLTDTTNYTGNGINVGLYYGSGFTFNGNINDFRVTTGVARYTANFTPPTASFPLS